ncbi:MAG TPA: DEAD/DEAH box helicase family protein, partial [Gammaproteobacteria bacterium]|nr:DEAD/DEAH box helicase family protein [Gammaproteobacteria bacterium]
MPLEAMGRAAFILRVAVPSPLRRSFDYLPPPGVDPQRLAPGMRLRVPFGRRNVVGVLLEVVAQPRIEQSRLKPAVEALDTQAILPPPLLRLAEWASDYYHHPPGEVFSHLLPGLLRQGRAPRRQMHTSWQLTEAGRAVSPDDLGGAPRQAAILKLLQTRQGAVSQDELAATFTRCRSPLKGLQQKGWVTAEQAPAGIAVCTTEAQALSLNPAQAGAVDAVGGSLGQFQGFLLEGVTGSGKTEVYLRIIEQVIARGEQALVLLPEIG